MKRILLAAALVALGATSSLADPVADREAMMKSFGGAVGGLAPIARGEQPYDAAKVQAALASLAAAVEKFDAAALFPAGSTGGNSAALPAIWDNWADFEARVAKLKADVAEVAASTPADQAAVGAALGRIGASCGGCHEAYRAKKS